MAWADPGRLGGGPTVLIFSPVDWVDRLEAELADARDAATPELLLQLAWQVRQTDGARAVTLCERALAHASAHGLPPESLATVDLLLGERALLVGDVVTGTRHLAAALDRLTGRGASLVQGNGWWLQASIAQERGDQGEVDASLGRALVAYAQVDTEAGRWSVQAARARQLANLAFRDHRAAAQALEREFGAGQAQVPGVLAWVEAAAANVASLSNRLVEAIKLDLSAQQYAAQSGQMRQFVISASNAAEGFTALGDLDAALEWSERGMAQARDSGWPSLMATCQRHAGEVLRLLERPADARRQLTVAAQAMAPLSVSRNKVEVLTSLAQLDLDEGRFEAALTSLQGLEPAVASMGEADLLLKIWRGQALALGQLGDQAAAQRQAQAALGLARDKGQLEEQIKAWQVLAAVAHISDLRLGQRSGARLAALQQALVLAQDPVGSPVPADLLQQLASACADGHDFESAYRYAQAAEEARRRSRLAEAENRLQAMSIRHEVTRAHADTERHKRLAAKLQATADTLERLGLIGREITASLDAQQVGQTVMRHACALLEVRTFFLYVLDTSGQALNRLVVENGGEAQPSDQIALDIESSLLARCARERREIVIERDAAGASKSHLPGTLPSLSLLFFPLEVAGRLLGVMSVQSTLAGAYGERELAIFRTLCAWAAIGLDNAAAYAALASQEQELRVAAAAFESQLAMLITDGNGAILRVNQSGLRLTGYAMADLRGRHPDMLLPERIRATTAAQWRAAMAADGAWEGESMVRRADGQEVPMWASVAVVRAGDGEISHVIYTAADITERKRAEEEIRLLAFFDPLTRLPNRRLLMDRLAHALATSGRSGAAGAMLFLDLDKFKTLNDTRGHDVGDQLLEQVGARLSAQVRDSDTVARLGGDEFVVLLEGLGAGMAEAADQADQVARKIQLALAEPYVLGGQLHHSSPSMGVSVFKGQAVGVDELLRQADLAMYQAKAAGRNTVRFFDPTMQAAVSAHAQLEADLRLALAGGQFELHHQAQADMQGRIAGTEALLRWRHPERGMVSPADFIPVAEESGLILPLGQWVLETAVHTLERWADHPALARLSVAVNISARQFHSPQFVPQVLALLDQAAIEPRRLKLELTESLLLENVESVIDKMHALKARGVRFSLDDFGTGYSSLSYLKRLPLQELKIDQSFVRDIFVDDNDVAIVRAIVTLGQSLGLQVIAEGVETPEQQAFLAHIGCQAYQGYLFARPVPVADFEARVAELSASEL